MKVGILIEGQEGLTWARWRRLAAAVDELGFDSLWRSDHFMSSVDSTRETLELWTALSVAAVETRRVWLGSLVSPITFRPPALLALMAADVDALSGGRLVLGLGAGWNDREHAAFGIPFPPVSERLDRLEEGIQVIRALHSAEPAEFSGRFYRLQGAPPKARPPGQPPLPLLIGGSGEKRMLRIVARYADQWDVCGGLTPETYRAKARRLDEYCHELGREPGAILRSLSTAYLVGRNRQELEARAAVVQQLLPGFEHLRVAEVLTALRAIGWRVGTPEQIIENLRALADEGVQRVILQHNDLDDLDALELIAREILPVTAEWR